MKFNEISSTSFFNNAYVNYASYDNIRKIPSLVDGQKNAARKILWYILKKNIKNDLKVSQLDSKVAEDTEYLHGSMAGVIVNLAQDYIGANNMNLLHPEGNFGTRLVQEASAPRYIYTYGSDNLFEQINKNDNDILEHQYFEGTCIEPKFLLPKLPLLLINGSEGISSGFATKILPRNPDEIKKYLKHALKVKTPVEFNEKPYYKGFKGTISQGETNNQWLIRGDFVRKANKIIITELPIGYSLKSYIAVLDKLEEDKKIISYKDLSDGLFNFEVIFNRKYIDSLDDEEVIKLLKLEKKVSENYTVIDEKNRVQIFDNVNDIMQKYIEVKLDYLEKRKNNQIKTLTQDIKELISRYTFIKEITEDNLVVQKRKEQDIIKDLDKIKNIIKIDDSYNYLLNMSIRSLTVERMKQLMDQIKAKKAELDEIKTLSINDIWLREI